VSEWIDDATSFNSMRAVTPRRKEVAACASLTASGMRTRQVRAVA
jgi:hypothetical protein